MEWIFGNIRENISVVVQTQFVCVHCEHLFFGLFRQSNVIIKYIDKTNNQHPNALIVSLTHCGIMAPYGEWQKWKMYAIKQIKICGAYRDMVPTASAGLSGTHGLWVSYSGIMHISRFVFHNSLFSQVYGSFLKSQNTMYKTFSQHWDLRWHR